MLALRRLGELSLRRCFLRALGGRCQLAPGGVGVVLGATSTLFQLAPGGHVEFPLRRQFAPGGLRFVPGASSAVF